MFAQQFVVFNDLPFGALLPEMQKTLLVFFSLFSPFFAFTFVLIDCCAFQAHSIHCFVNTFCQQETCYANKNIKTARTTCQG